MKTTIINKILLVLMLITAQQVSALEFQVDGIYYRTSIFTKNSAYVTHSGTSYTESVEYQGEVVIPESVTYNGKTYTIASIGGYAFAGCPGLTSVTIPSTVTTINQNAFNGCTGLKTIECKATTPPALGDNAFTSYDATLVVPSSSESAYKSAAGWSNFKFKEEPSETPGSGENSGEDSGSDNSGSDNTYGLACKILNSTDVAIIAGSEKYTGDIVIPSQVTISGKTYTVTSIANDAFKGCTGLTSITIPSSITSIGSSSFDSCNNLNKVNISDILSWCKITFANSLANPLYYAKKLYLNGTLVTKLEIPSAITEIKNYTFYNCTSISTIVFPSGILKIGNSAFVNCSNMTSVTIPNSVTTIDENAFNGCTGLTSLTIGSSVGSIGNYAFGNCTGLKSVTSLNSTPPTCGTGVFQGVTISSIPLTVPAGSESLYKATYTWQDFKYKEESENPGDDPAVDTSGLKYNIISSTDVEVVAGTEKYTGDIVIPSQTTIDGKTYNVTKIGIQAFNGCAGLTSITIPNSVYIIADESIYDCSALKSITIPSSVTSIGNYVLSMCPSLTSIVVESGNVKYDSRNNCNAIIETSTNTLIAGCKKTVIPSSVSIIGTAAFYGCTGLTSITIPSSVVSLGEGAFFDCTGLTSISIPNSVTSIGENVFAYCENLKTVTLSNKIKTISFSAFSGCYSLTGIEIPNSVTTIDEEAFSYCESITNITIGENVNSIGKCAFMSCNGLSRISTLNPTPPTCGENVFKNVNVSNVTLTVPTGSVSIYKSADIWKDFKYEQTEEEPSEPELPTDNSGLSYNILNSTEVEVIAGAEKYTGDIVIPSQTTIDGKVYNITQIGDAAFQDCTNLTSVTIPNLVVSIGESALKGCINLISVVIGNSVTSIGNSAFYGCTSLTSVTIPNSVTSIGNYAFYGNSNLTSVTSLNPTPPTCGTDVFGGVNVSDILLIVPAGSKSLYNTTDTWKDFKYKVFVGDVVEVNGLSYKIVSETTVSLIAGSGKYSGKIVVPSEITIYGNKYNVIDIGDMAFYGCTDLTSVTIPNSVISIGDNAMKGCTGLTSVTIGNSVASIGSSAFYDCANLKDVFISELSAWCKIDFGSSFSNPLFHAHVLNLNGTEIKDLVIPESVNEIKSYAFSSCTGLTSITIHKSVSNIGDYAFESCTNLTSITVQNPTPPTCGTDVFESVNVGNITLEVPAESVSLYQSADTWKDFGSIKGISEEEPELPEDTSGLSYNILNETDVEVVAGTEKYTGDIVIPSQTTIDGKVYNVTKVGNEAFYECTGLTSVTIGNSVTSIGIHAFNTCIRLTSVTIPNSVTSIGGSAFRNCSGLTSVTIPNSVTSIGDYAFSGCNRLTSVTIPNSVTSIGRAAFAYCSGLESIIVESGNIVYDSRDNCNAIIETSTNILITGCKNTVISNSVTGIGEYAFYGCSGLTSVTIGNSATSIGGHAFSNCSGLTRVTSLSTTPPTCGTDVFYNVSVGNITLEVPAESVSMYQSADTWKDFGTIETYISYPVGLSKMWAIPADAATSLCSVRTGNGFGDTFFGSNYQAGVIEEWKDGVLVASYDVNKFCADNQLGETVMVIDSETGTETEKFQSYLLWTAVMVDDAGNLLVNVGPGPGTASTCQNWVLLPASDRNAMQLLHIDEFPSADVTLGRVDVPSRIVGNITDGGAYLYIPATGSALMPVMYIALDGDGKIYYDAENSWILMSSLTFDASTNVATFQTADEILGAADEAAVAAKTYVRWRGRGAFTWNAETSQLEKNTAIPQGTGTPGMDIFKIGDVEYIVLPVNSATTGNRCSSIAVYNLADGSEVANWDSGCSVDYYVGSVQARVNADGKTANIYVCGHKDCFGILKFYPGSSVKSIANEGLSYGKDSSALDEIVTEENAAVEYYNLQGVRVMNPSKGLYIKREGGKTSKVVL